MDVQIDQLALRTPSGRCLLGPLSLELRSGECVVLLGPSGAGKSLLLTAVLGLLPPGVECGSGEVRWRGGGRRPEWDACAWLPQDPMLALVGSLTLRDHLRLMGGLDRRGRVTGRAGSLLEGLLLSSSDGFLGCVPRALSGGEAQRFGLVLALLGSPELLLLDEPTASLDPAASDALLGLLRAEHQCRGMGWLLSTQDLELAQQGTDRVMVLSGGQVVEVLRPPLLRSRLLTPCARQLVEAAEGPPGEAPLLV